MTEAHPRYELPDHELTGRAAANYVIALTFDELREQLAAGYEESVPEWLAFTEAVAGEVAA